MSCRALISSKPTNVQALSFKTQPIVTIMTSFWAEHQIPMSQMGDAKGLRHPNFKEHVYTIKGELYDVNFKSFFVY